MEYLDKFVESDSFDISGVGEDEERRCKCISIAIIYQTYFIELHDWQTANQVDCFASSSADE